MLRVLITFIVIGIVIGNTMIVLDIPLNDDLKAWVPTSTSKMPLCRPLRHAFFKYPLTFLWSKGPLPHTEYNTFHTEYRTSYYGLVEYVKKSQKNGFIWIRTGSPAIYMSDLDIFAEMLHELDNPIILVSGDGDRSVPSEVSTKTVENICTSPMIKKWYTQNYDDCRGKHEKIHPYPIGLDLHTQRDNTLKTVDDKAHALFKICRRHCVKSMKIFCDIAASSQDRFGGQRKRVADILKELPHAQLLTNRVSQVEIWEMYASHEFVVSPPGNGIDCHRTWEVLLMGSIPIVLTSCLDPLFYGLPVIILNDWNELKDGDLIKWKKSVQSQQEHVHETLFDKMPFSIKTYAEECEYDNE